MSFFPSSTFRVLFPNGIVTPGERLDGMLVIEAPEPIARAERIDLVFESVVVAKYGEGATQKVLFQSQFKFDLPKDVPFAAGEHRYPFSVDIPDWLPPGLEADVYWIRHTVTARLDVDWAVDPIATVVPIVVMRGIHGVRRALTMRSHPTFHEQIVVEVMLPSAVIASDEPLTGQIALRNGHDAPLEAIELTLMSVATIVMGSHDRRTTPISRVLIPAAGLHEGKSLDFTFPPTAPFPPSFRTSYIDHGVVLVVTAQIPWRFSPSFEVPLEVLPQGSTIEGPMMANIVGGDRLRRISIAMAQSSGLHEGAAHSPTLAYGDFGPVKVAILDAPNTAGLGVDLDFTFPDLELGILLRPLGRLELSTESDASLLPRSMANYSLRFDPPDARAKIDSAAILLLIHAVVGDPLRVEKIRLSDHHLAFHLSLADDEEPTMIEVARVACAHAKVIGEAVSALPFPTAVADTRAAWQATADEQSAFLIPTGPSIYGITMRAQVIGGEERTLAITMRTIWKTETPTLQLVIDLRGNPIPEACSKQLEGETSSPLLKSVLAIFPIATLVARGGGVVLENAAWPKDPRTIFSTIEIFFAWVLEARGERRVDSPYR